MSRRRLLTIGHSYVVAANRVLAHQMAVQGEGAWEVTALAPARFHGDLREIAAEALPGEACTLETAPVHLDRVPHLMWYENLARVLKQPWDVVHCWEEPYVFAAAQVARATPAHASLVYATFQNLAKDYPWPLSAFERTTMRRADGWIAFGQTVHQTLASRTAYASTPSRVIPPGVDVDRFRPDADGGRAIREKLGWPADANVVGYLGRFVPQKGLPLLLDALSACTAGWRALFVGGGPMEAELRAFADRHPRRVHVQTGVPHDDVPAWLNAMSVLCAPSQTTPAWREQFGRMLIEAMACGVPVIASDSGEMPSVVGDAATIVSESDVTQWTAAIDHLLDTPSLRSGQAASGRARAERRFAWPVVARAHLDFFESLPHRD
jgi:phosphatidylinositol alpha-1,6-mannosyltransferase